MFKGYDAYAEGLTGLVDSGGDLYINIKESTGYST